ncbi:hypothetical protein KAH27_07120 [bacterium]|nr:hypothetical protein [bacterium]
MNIFTFSHHVYYKFIILLTVLSLNISALTNYVWSKGTHTPPYTNWIAAATNIQAAVDEANNGDVVLVTNGNYLLYDQVIIDKRITVRSVNGAKSTFFVGQFPSITNRGFYIDHADAVIEGLTIRNCGGVSKGAGVYFNKNGTVKNCIILYNLASSAGGGVYCNECGILISNSINKNISFDNGGGLFLFKGGVANYCNIGYNRSSHNGGGVAYNSSGKLTECVIVSNSSSWGGGVHLYKGGTIQNCEILTNLATQGGGGVHLNTYGTVENCVISENMALGARGGGVHTENGGTVRNSAIINNRSGVDSAGIHCHVNGLFENCIITGNVAGAVAGGVYFYLGGTAIYCRISENIAGTFGGGVYSRSGGAVRYSLILNNKAVNNGGGIFISGYGHLQNSLVAGNSSDAIGGGMYLRNGANVDSCTVAGNSAIGDGGGVVCFSSSMVRNTVSYFNSASNSPDFLSTGDGCTSVYVCSSSQVAGEGNITNDPLFQCIMAGNYRLTTNSPCVNSGTNLPWMTGAEDLDGGQRIINDRVDIGAYEYGSVSTPYICLNTDIIDFGGTIIMSENVQTVTVQNVGAGTLSGEVTNVSLPFSVTSGIPYSMEESEETLVIFSFSPTGNGTFSNSVVFTGGGDATALLIGTAIPEPFLFIILLIPPFLKGVRGI